MSVKELKILIFTDNYFVYKNFKKIIKNNKLDKKHAFVYACTPENPIFSNITNLQRITIKKAIGELKSKFDLIISCHCKQIFPKELVESVRCINIHPGFNPFNRGWYPQAFSIINKLPMGVTIHEMDAEIDHGDIIKRKEVEVFGWDTSLTAYERVITAEIQLLENHIEEIINNTYITKKMEGEGNYNSRRDFDALCNLDLNEKTTMAAAIDKLRALTHGDFENAYFYDELGNKIFVGIKLHKANLKD